MKGMNRFELRLAATESSAKAIKLLRGYFPNTSISEWKQKIEDGEPVFSCNAGSYDGKKSMMKIIHGLQREKIPFELFEQTENNTYPLDVKLLWAFIDRGKAIGRQVIQDMENEADG